MPGPWSAVGGAPPRFVRSTRYLYRFAEPVERSAGRHWWARDLGEAYCPTFVLRGGALSPVSR